MLKEIFEKNKDIVINTDIDGFLCGMILQKYYGCRVVGFSNSRETIWLISEIEDINAPIYIDILWRGLKLYALINILSPLTSIIIERYLTMEQK